MLASIHKNYKHKLELTRNYRGSISKINKGRVFTNKDQAQDPRRMRMLSIMLTISQLGSIMDSRSFQLMLLERRLDRLKSTRKPVNQRNLKITSSILTLKIRPKTDQTASSSLKINQFNPKTTTLVGICSISLEHHQQLNKPHQQLQVARMQLISSMTLTSDNPRYLSTNLKLKPTNNQT